MSEERSIFDDYNPDQGVAPSSFPAKEKLRTLEYGKPIVCRLILNPLLKDADGKMMYYYRYSNFWYNFTKKDGKVIQLPRTSLEVAGKTDAQHEAYVRMRQLQKELDKKIKASNNPSNEDVAQLKKIETIVEKFRENFNMVILIHEKGTDRIEALSLPITQAVKLFGKPASDQTPAEEGLIQKLKSKGVNPFDLKQDRGWFKLYKTGTCRNDTEYHIELATEPTKVRLEDGSEEFIDKPIKCPVSQSLFSMKASDIPDIVKIISQDLWTSDEINAYLKSHGTVIPERVHRTQKIKVDLDDTATISSIDSVLMAASSAALANPDLLVTNPEPTKTEVQTVAPQEDTVIIPTEIVVPPVVNEPKATVKRDPLDDLF